MDSPSQGRRRAAVPPGEPPSPISSLLLPDPWEAAAAAGEEGLVYLLHLDPPYRHARHYTGWSERLPGRLEEHRTGRGARLLQVAIAAGGTFHLVRTWPGGPDRERAIKDRREAPSLCPICTPSPRPVAAGRSGVPAAAKPAPRPAGRAAGQTANPYLCGEEMGTQMARQFLQGQLAAGRTAAQIATAHDRIIGPWRAASARHRPRGSAPTPN